MFRRVDPVSANGPSALYRLTAWNHGEGSEGFRQGSAACGRAATSGPRPAMDAWHSVGQIRDRSRAGGRRSPTTLHALAPTSRRTELRDHLRWRSRRHASSGGYGTLQKASYLLLIFVFMPFMILTGVAQSPGFTAAMPVLLDLFGGRQSARTLHTIGTVLLVLFVAVHLLEIAAAGFVNRVRSMITGKELIPVDRGAMTP